MLPVFDALKFLYFYTKQRMEIEKIFKEIGYDVQKLPNINRDLIGISISKESFHIIFDFTIDLLHNDDFWKSKSDLLKTLFFNNIFFPINTILEEEDIEKFIESNYPQQTPSEKAIRVLEFLNSMASYDGQEIGLNKSELAEKELWRHVFLKNMDEFMYYFETLQQMKYIEVMSSTKQGFIIRLTISGLERIIVSQQNKTSKYCFIAMSFDSDLTDLYDKAIQPALLQTGFVPLIVNKEHIDSDVTINDAILASIKKARFTIADFTRHKHGVYFEAGYALGRGQKVIYTCKQDEISKAHFDTRNYQHIVWSDYEDLRIQLINKIEAFIIE